MAGATDAVAAAPERYAALLIGTDGSQRHPDLRWSAKAYVFHAGDNLRIWSERLAGALAGADRTLAAYDDNLLAVARAYEETPVPSALWSLERAVADWCDLVPTADERGVQLAHPERGALTVADVARSNCHDVIHHEWDILRSTSGRA